MRYLPHTPEEIAAMLAAIGKPSIDALFEHDPARGARSIGRSRSSPRSTSRA